jgi:hypothetical protein
MDRPFLARRLVEMLGRAHRAGRVRVRIKH